MSGNAFIESPLNLLNNSTLNVAQKVVFNGQAAVNGVGSLFAAGGLEFNAASTTTIGGGAEVLSYGPINGPGAIQLAGGTLTTRVGAPGVATGWITIGAGGRLIYIGAGAAEPAALTIQAGGVLQLLLGQRLRTTGNLLLSGELKLDGDRSQFDGDVELRAGGGGANLTITAGGKLEVDDATLNFPGGAELQANSQLRILGGTNELFGPVTSAGAITAFSGANVFRGSVNNTGSMWLGFDSSNVFFGSFFQFGTLHIGNALVGDSNTATTTFRNTYRGLGATGDGNLIFVDRITPSSSVGPIATATFDTNVQLGAAATLELRLGEGPLLSRLAVTRHLQLSGALNFQALNLSREFTIGESFDLLDWGTLSGTFSSLILPQLGPGQIWNTSQLYTTGVLSVAAGIPGDYNSNGVVDAADYTRYRDALGTNTVLPNDPTGGIIGATQYNTWRNNFGQSGNSSALAAMASVPEPASVVVLLTLFALSPRCLCLWATLCDLK